MSRTEHMNNTRHGVPLWIEALNAIHGPGHWTAPAPQRHPIRRPGLLARILASLF